MSGYRISFYHHCCSDISSGIIISSFDLDPLRLISSSSLNHGLQRQTVHRLSPLSGEATQGAQHSQKDAPDTFMSLVLITSLSATVSNPDARNAPARTSLVRGIGIHQSFVSDMKQMLLLTRRRGPRSTSPFSISHHMHPCQWHQPAALGSRRVPSRRTN